MILVSFGSAGVDWIAPAKIFRQTLEIAPAAHICDKNRYQFSELDCSFIDFIIYISFRLIELVLLASPIRFCFVSFFFFYSILFFWRSLPLFMLFCVRKQIVITSRRSKRRKQIEQIRCVCVCSRCSPDKVSV